MTDTKIRGLPQQAFKKFDVNIEQLEKEIKLKNFDLVEYDDRNGSSIFGEREALSYSFKFSTYNIEYEIKFMSFEYKSKTELLKLYIQCHTPHILKELKTCRNFLQRKRNLQLTFTTLIAFSRYYESRRLICDLLLKKAVHFKILENEEGGKIVAYSDTPKQAKVGIFWTIEWTQEQKVFDKIEVFYKLSTLPNKEDLRGILTDLTEPNLEFDKKFSLWRSFVAKISNSVIVLDVSEEEDDILVLRSPKLTNVKKEIKQESESDEEVDGQEFLKNFSKKDTPVSTERPSSTSMAVKDVDVIDLDQYVPTTSSRRPNFMPSAVSLYTPFLQRCRRMSLVHDYHNDVRSSNGRKHADSTDGRPPAKRSKMDEDDDLECTGVTYLVPD